MSYRKRVRYWWYVAERIKARVVKYPQDAETRRQLSTVRYRAVNSNGKIQLDPKDETKKLLRCSPDQADAYVMGIYGLQFTEPESMRIRRSRRQRHHEGASFMAV